MNKNKSLYRIVVIFVFIFFVLIISYSKSLASSNLVNNQNNDSQFLVTRINSLYNNISKINTLNKKSTSNKNQVQIQEAKERKELMKELMKKDPFLFNELAIKSNERATLPSIIQNDIERMSTISGEITTIYIDDFENKNNGHYEYYIDTPTMRYSFYPTSEVPLLSGTNIKVTGYVIDDQISTNIDQNPIKKFGDEPILDSVGDQRTLVFLVKSFSGDVEPFTPAEGKKLVFDGQFQNFMKSQSYNKVKFSGDVVGWVSNNEKIISSCMFLTGDQIKNAVNTYKIDLAKYDRIVYLLDGVGGGCSIVGKSSLFIDNTSYSVSQASVGLYNYNSPSGWGAQPFTWTNLDYVLSHELGHSLGVSHANSWLCEGGQILYGNCQHQEYGNYYDTMGTTSYSLNFNAYFKEKLGWIPKKQVLSITKSGTYTLNPLEYIKGNGARLAKIYIKDTTENSYFAEFRKAVGFDSNLDKAELSNNQNGIFINRVEDSNLATELLDMSHTSQNNIKDVTLNLPSTKSSVYSFVDPGRGITIGPVLNVSKSLVSFQVKLEEPSCTYFNPIINNFSTSYEVAADSSGYVSAMVRNNDYYGCDQSNFDVDFILPSGWQFIKYNTDLIYISPGKSEWMGGDFFIPKGTLPGNYSLSFQVINKTSYKMATENFNIHVNEPLNITGISPTIATLGTNITVTGTGFNPTQNHVIFNEINGNSWSKTQIVPSSDGKIIFIVPNTMTTCDGNSGGCKDFPTPNGDYVVNVYSNGSSASFNFYVGQKYPIPIVTISASPNFLVTSSGMASIISWSSIYATSCQAYGGWYGTRPISGSVIVYPTTTTNYGITCTGPGGNNSKSTIVTVGITPIPLICDYAAPPLGCKYINGPNYNKTTKCGMVLSCPSIPVIKNLDSVSLNSALKSQSANILGALDNSSDQKKSETKLDESVNNSQKLVCGEFTMTLKKGMKNEEVKCLQKILNEKGFKVKGTEVGKETTYFGSATLVAFKAFQLDKQLIIDGIFGPISRKALKDSI